MKKIFILFTVLFLGSFALHAQNSSGNMKVEETREAHYPDGEDALVNHIFYGIKYSPAAKEAKAQGTLSVMFNVNPDSTLSNIRVLNDPGHGIGDNVKEILGMVKFIPAMANGIVIRSQVMMNIPYRAH
ncbi:MAG: energy transducer TonB [Cytophagaceae bacterium]